MEQRGIRRSTQARGQHNVYDKNVKTEAVDISLTSVDEKSKSANRVDLIAQFLYYF